MCGIAGVFHPDPETARAAVTAMTRRQAHRGPDDEGVQLLPVPGGWLGLGQRRLAILDLSPAGHQPMAHAPTGCWITFNGEIYNYRALRRDLEAEGETFRGTSDTEVLLAGLARHGPAYLERLEGMFAFAFFDPRVGRLLLARDPVGIKPLYFARAGDAWLVASEVRAILASALVSRRVDPPGLAGLLAYGAVPQPRTLFRDVRALAPGTWLEVAPGPDGAWAAGPPRRYWTYPRTNPAWTEKEAVPRLAATLDAAVRDHLVSDVPVGVFLSSGLDSSLVAGLAARHVPHLLSFTVVFTDQPDFSEQHLAAATARLFGLDHLEVPLPAAESEGAARDWLDSLDQPSMDGLNVYIISRAVRRYGIKVALSGLGGDELFGGYPSFRDVPRLARVIAALRRLSPRARHALAACAGLGRSTAVRAKLADMFATDGSLLALTLQRRRVLSNAQMASLGLAPAALGLTPDYLPPEALDGLDLDPGDPVATVSRLESHFYQGNVLLRDADTNGMAQGLEIRVPLLARPLLDLVHAIPGRVRLPPRAPGKYLLRQAAASLLRPELRRQPKRGFVLPLRRWMTASLRPVCEQGLAALKDLGLLQPAGVDAIWRAFLGEPESPLWTRALTLSVLGHFVRNTGASA